MYHNFSIFPQKMFTVCRVSILNHTILWPKATLLFKPFYSWLYWFILFYTPFSVQAESDLNELKALMHSPSAIVVSGKPSNPETTDKLLFLMPLSQQLWAHSSKYRDNRLKFQESVFDIQHCRYHRKGLSSYTDLLWKSKTKLNPTGCHYC